MSATKIEQLEQISQEIEQLTLRAIDAYNGYRNKESISICNELDKLYYQKLKLQHELGLIKKWKPR